MKKEWHYHSGPYLTSPAYSKVHTSVPPDNAGLLTEWKHTYFTGNQCVYTNSETNKTFRKFEMYVSATTVWLVSTTSSNLLKSSTFRIVLFVMTVLVLSYKLNSTILCYFKSLLVILSLIVFNVQILIQFKLKTIKTFRDWFASS